MKYLICLFSLITSTLYGQITLEQTYATNFEKAFYCTNIGNDNYKYVLEDYINSEINLYNLDHSPYMLNIPTPIPLGIYEVMYITSGLFDCDTSNIEYVLSAPTTGNESFYVYRTDGTLLWSKDSVQGPYCFGCHGGSLIDKPIINTPTGAKMFLFDPAGNYHVYALCGELPTSISEIEYEKNAVLVFPNPSTESVTFEISSPTNIGKCELIIFNSMMQSISSQSIEGETKITKPISEYSSGIYYFSFKSNSKVIQTGKFVVN